MTAQANRIVYRTRSEECDPAWFVHDGDDDAGADLTAGGTYRYTVAGPGPKEHVRCLPAAIRADEADRRLLSRLLYDDFGQMLSLLKLDIDWLQRATFANQESSHRFRQMQHLLDHLISQTREIASRLRPPLLDDFGLFAAVDWLASSFQTRSGIACTVRCNDRSRALSDELASTAYRVAQECVTNVERHARATHVEIVLWHTSQHLAVIVRDNGIGLPPDATRRIGCHGLAAVKERIQAVGGTLQFGDTVPQGTVIHATIPVDDLPPQATKP